MTNTEIRAKFKLTAQLMELQGENPFKIRAYQNIRETISSLPTELSEMTEEEISAVEGIGKGMTENIRSLLSVGSFGGLDKYHAEVPEGVIEMLGISGFGPKKIGVLWKEAGAKTLEDLLFLCETGQVASLKGFAEKSQQTLKEAVQFLMKCRGKAKYAALEPIVVDVLKRLEGLNSVREVSETGDYRRRCEVLDVVELLVATDDYETTRMELSGLKMLSDDPTKSGPFSWVGNTPGIDVVFKIRFCSPQDFHKELFMTTASTAHLNTLSSEKIGIRSKAIETETETHIYKSLGLSYIEPEMREGLGEVEKARTGSLPELIELEDLKGVLHNHSTYSDGKHTLKEMAVACKDLGYEYLGISDHSQTAVYANGLQDFRVKQQQEEIRQLNEELAPFKILSGIESDILADGSLDYSDEVLSSFDFVVASIHSGLNMDKAKATQRLLTAIHNPYTTILGHMTGRLILEREGYPVDHRQVIDACAEKNVVIEINASPYRLDIDWRWIDYCLEKEVMLSINPDAHKIESYQDMKYGVLVGRKGGLTRNSTLNAMSLNEIEDYLTNQKG